MSNTTFSIVAKANIQDATWIKHVLELNGVTTHLWGGSIAAWDPLTIVTGGVDPVRVVVAASDEIFALKLIEEIDQPMDDKTVGPWICLTCGEKVDGNFALCWNCQKERPQPL